MQEQLIEKLMALPNSIWSEAIDHASKVTKLKFDLIASMFQDVTILTDQEVLKNLAHILKTNVAACKSIGAPFFSQVCCLYMNLIISHHFQLKRILNDMLSVYQVISSNLNKAVNDEGEQVLKWPLIKQMRVVKKEILTLLSTWISRAFEGRQVMDLESLGLKDNRVYSCNQFYVANRLNKTKAKIFL